MPIFSTTFAAAVRIFSGFTDFWTVSISMPFLSAPRTDEFWRQKEFPASCTIVAVFPTVTAGGFLSGDDFSDVTGFFLATGRQRMSFFSAPWAGVFWWEM